MSGATVTVILRVFAEHISRNNHPHDFVGALEDLMNAQVAQILLDLGRYKCHASHRNWY